MRNLTRNKSKLFYQNIESTEEEISNGYKTGNKINIYSKPEILYIMTSFPKGNLDNETLGILTKYDRVCVDKKENSIVKEQARIFINNAPNELNDNWDFICETIIYSLNQVYYGLKERN